MLAALNTGHDGGLTTLHANTAGDVPARLEALAAAAGMPRAALHAQAAAALHVCVHLRRTPDGRRGVEAIGVFRRRHDDSVAVVSAVTRTGRGPAYDELVRLVAAAGVRPPTDAGWEQARSAGPVDVREVDDA